MSWVSSALSTVGSLFSGGGIGGASWGGIISGGIQAYGQYSAGKAQKDAAKEEAKAQVNEGRYKQIEYEFQAGQADRNAQLAIDQASNKALVIRQQGQKAVSRVAVNYAASGVVSGVGSAGEVEARTWGNVMQDVYTTNLEGASQAANLRNQAGAYRQAGAQALEAGNVAANATSKAASINNKSSLLNTAASIASIWS